MILRERFDLAVLARKRSKRGTIEMRPIGPRLSSETELYRIILRVLKEYDDAKPELLRGALVTKQELTLDAYGLGDIVRAMRTAFSQATNLARSNVESLFEGDARRHDERWIDQVNRVVGVDLKAVVRSEQIAPTIEAAVQTNVALIRGLSEEVAKKVEVTLLEMIPRGASTREMAKTLNDIGNFGKARAKLIAIDQTSSFNSNLNQIRQRQAGVDRYIWSTSRDARVRPLHRAREGETFRWDTPPSDGHPGRPVRCRCVARPVLDLDAPAVRKSERNRARREGTRAVEAALGL